MKPWGLSVWSEVSLIDTNCLLRSDSFVTACTALWMKKILKDRIKPFAVVVEESLEQAAHMLSKLCLMPARARFYHSFSGTSTDLKWATITVGNWRQFWLGRMRRALAAESGVHLLKPSETDSNTGLSGWQCPQQFCRERGNGAAREQRAGGESPASQAVLHWWSAVPSCSARTAGHGPWGWWAQMQLRDHQTHLYGDRSGASEEITPGRGLSAGTPQLRCKARTAQGRRRRLSWLWVHSRPPRGAQNEHQEFGFPTNGDLRPLTAGKVLVLEQGNSWGRRHCQQFLNCLPQILSPGQHFSAALFCDGKW